jgi:glycosyltransferase involved in cell wall biosynthesis
MGFRLPIEVLPNFINIADYKPQSDVTGATICYVGRLSKEKGVSTLIEAMEGLPDVHLKIIGDGPLRAELQERARSKNINNVSFLGHLASDQVKEEVRACRFAVCPSEWYENNPRSVIEAFAMGKPVIGARIGGIPELVRDNETGLTFESGNARELASVISELVSSPERCAVMGKRARQWVEEELNPEKHYDRLMGIYQRAIGKKKKI